MVSEPSMELIDHDLDYGRWFMVQNCSDHKPSAIPHNLPMLSRVIAEFRARFGTDPALVAVAPGRVNLIGEHTDYNDGFVFPAAIDRATWVAASPAETTELFSLQAGDAGPFRLADLQPGEVEGWGKYPGGMAWAMRQEGLATPDLKAVVTSDIPMGSGVSSSAALEMAFGTIWNALGGLELSPRRLAEMGKACENRFVGVNSGIMDQMASASGRAGFAMFLDTRTLEIQYARVPDGLSIVLLDTKTPRTLAGSAYNERRAQCEAACRHLGVPALRDADEAMLEAKREGMDETVYRRARHIVTENARCLAFAEALNAGRTQEIGTLMRESHESLRYDYEVSCPELDRMAEAAWAAPGCVGARMTGAGFGGACVALVQTDKTEEFIGATLARYRQTADREGEAMVCGIAQGAHIAHAPLRPQGFCAAFGAKSDVYRTLTATRIDTSW
ncbi:galactokinase [soil metagenome]